VRIQLKSPWLVISANLIWHSFLLVVDIGVMLDMLACNSRA
jgi:hypothetical protein